MDQLENKKQAILTAPAMVRNMRRIEFIYKELSLLNLRCLILFSLQLLTGRILPRTMQSHESYL